MRLRLASRQSDLARWQAVEVARRLGNLAPEAKIEFQFKSSLGDQNLDLPLAQMGSKGVFTEDFYQDLKEGRCDLVVHSWKDLPTEPRAGTLIAATLPRADVRDILVVPRAVWARATETLTILTSSPRRVYNLGAALPTLLPGRPRLNFENVRGNVATRLRKMHERGAALVLAKAGLDRLLAAEAENFVSVSIRNLIADCRFMILPTSLNPPAPAQGALAIEVARDAAPVATLARGINDQTTYRAVTRERDVLREHGGGCHQKIGVAVLPRDFGVVFGLRGLTEAGETLDAWRIESDVAWTRAESPENLFPRAATDNSWFTRWPVRPARALAREPALFVARAEALPEDFTPPAEQTVWTAGAGSWAKLARRGVWVSGCQDGLGENEPCRLEHLWPNLRFTKLTHRAAAGPTDLATYELADKPDVPDLRGKTHFFWMSGTSFARARRLFPEEIAGGRHSCGPGATYDYLKGQPGLKHPIKVFVGLAQFLAES